jgi:hypothetical protein
MILAVYSVQFMHALCLRFLVCFLYQFKNKPVRVCTGNLFMRFETRFVCRLMLNHRCAIHFYRSYPQYTAYADNVKAIALKVNLNLNT